MKRLIFISLILLFSNIVLSQQSKISPLSAEISLIETAPNNGKNRVLLGLSFTNNSNENIFVAMLMRNGGVFNIYKNNKYYSTLVDYFFSGKDLNMVASKKDIKNQVISDPPPLNVMGILYNKYIIDSISIKNKNANMPIIKNFLEKNKAVQSNRKLYNFLKNDCLFLKAHETYKYYFICPIEDVLKDNGDYTIKYEPKLNIENPSLKSIDKVLSYHRIFPDKIDCNTLSIKIIPSN